MKKIGMGMRVGAGGVTCAEITRMQRLKHINSYYALLSKSL